MPRDDNAPKIAVYDPIHRGELPRTRFVDWLDAITVDMVYYPDRDRLMAALEGMTVAAWAESVEDLPRAAKMYETQHVSSGRALPLGLEVPSFVFLVGGISRIITHQIVRNRLGTVFSQKGTANQDIRHQDVLVPRALNRPVDTSLLEVYIQQHLMFKNWYSQALDSGRHSAMSARYAMPHSMAQFIYVGINLAALQGLVAKRLCTCEAPEYNLVARKMKESVVDKFPEFGPLLRPACETPAGCYYQRTFGTSLGYTLHFPDALHDLGPYNPNSYVHQATRDELLDGPPFKTREYEGWSRLS